MNRRNFLLCSTALIACGAMLPKQSAATEKDWVRTNFVKRYTVSIDRNESAGAGLWVVNWAEVE